MNNYQRRNYNPNAGKEFKPKQHRPAPPPPNPEAEWFKNLLGKRVIVFQNNHAETIGRLKWVTKYTILLGIELEEGKPTADCLIYKSAINWIAPYQKVRDQIDARINDAMLEVQATEFND